MLGYDALDPMSSASTRQPEPVHRQLGLTDDELDALAGRQVI